MTRDKTPIKTIILGAGQGRRLLSLTENIPKCLLPISGKPIIERQIDALLAAGINEITVVTGFQSSLVEARCNNAMQIMHRSIRFLIRSSRLPITWSVAGLRVP